MLAGRLGRRSRSAALSCRRLRLPLIGAMVCRRNVDADQFLDIAQERRLFGVTQRNRHAGGSSSRRSADPVHICFRHVRQIVIHHMADSVNIDAASGDIGGDQRPNGPVAKSGEHPFALVLRLIPVHGFGHNAALCQTAHHLVRPMLGAGKHQSALDQFALQYLHESRRLRRAIDSDDALLNEVYRGADRGCGNLGRIAQHLVGKLGDGAAASSRKRIAFAGAREVSLRFCGCRE